MTSNEPNAPQQFNLSPDTTTTTDSGPTPVERRNTGRDVAVWEADGKTYTETPQGVEKSVDGSYSDVVLAVAELLGL